MAVVCVKCKGIFDSLLICSVDFGASGWMEILFFCDIGGGVWRKSKIPYDTILLRTRGAMSPEMKAAFGVDVD